MRDKTRGRRKGQEKKREGERGRRGVKDWQGGGGRKGGSERERAVSVCLFEREGGREREEKGE